MNKVIEKRKGSLRGNHLPKGEVVPLMSDSLFKKVYADSNHLERLNYLLSIILKKDVKVIRILNDELIGDSRLNRKKSVVDSWATSKFTDELKIVDGYSVRLIKIEELTNSFGYERYNTPSSYYYDKTSSTPSWLYNSSYSYWTMSPKDGYSYLVWGVNSVGDLGTFDVNDPNGVAVRPVVNVYKSAIQS